MFVSSTPAALRIEMIRAHTTLQALAASGIGAGAGRLGILDVPRSRRESSDYIWCTSTCGALHD
jgi:hypothetical protein